MAEGYDPNNIFGEISPIFSLSSTGAQHFSIAEQKVYRLGNIVYLYLVLQKISSITPSTEYTIGTCSIKPKGNVVVPQFSGYNSMIIQSNTGNVIFVDSTDTRTWYTYSCSFVAQ